MGIKLRRVQSLQEQLNKVKKSKIFSKFDIIIYIFVALLIVALFLGIYLPIQNSKLLKIQVIFDKKVIYEYDCIENVTKYIDNAFVNEIIDNNIRKVSFNNGEKHNLFSIENNTAKMLEANCSLRKDCVYSSQITKGGQQIVCLPHNLTIVGVGKLGSEIVF